MFLSNVNAQESYIIKNIEIIGNKKTKNYIIKRELSIKTGDTISLKSLKKEMKNSANNLVNTSLFHFANINFSIIDSSLNLIKISIDVTERWYLWPVPLVDTEERNLNTWWESKNFDKFSYGFDIKYTNSRGRMEVLHLYLLRGFNKQLGVSYEFPYINDKKTLGLGFSINNIRNHKVNHITDTNRQKFISFENSFAQTINQLGFSVKFRPNLYLTDVFDFSFYHFLINDSILDINPDYSPDLLNEFSFIRLYNKLKLDHRDYKSYPLEGYYADVELFKFGLGLFNNSLNTIIIKSNLRKYFKINNRFYAAFGGIFKISNNKTQPYALQSGLGYGRDLVRGYEYYVVDAKDFAVVKSNLKYAILNERVFEFNFIKSEKFNTIPVSLFLNVFADYGKLNPHRYNSKSNFLDNQHLLGYGLGLDFVTYYDKVMRLEIARNKLNETGFFVHFIAPI